MQKENSQKRVNFADLTSTQAQPPTPARIQAPPQPNSSGPQKLTNLGPINPNFVTKDQLQAIANGDSLQNNQASLLSQQNPLGDQSNFNQNGSL